ncbi:hypothetical protein FB567DRAFT_555763 [Paraphoma chrysanthemicola]|uniref:F-box domain-containing protein n=1 Tax=Paraphoma chrysanthemicola TaxID=798071 RepID=A0A8K0VRV5_9PLEO|nr:hypothetical protein FB567DRAFT_555763 [Paraphoma chrysanthemicola]
MATAILPAGYIKIEDSPSPEPIIISVEPVPVHSDAPVVVDPRDPEGFLKRCSGFNKKTRVRCGTTIGKKSEQTCHPTFLPTCRSHRDQQTFAGWCQFQHRNGERCGRLFRWTPPYFELCLEHQGHPDTPCYFFKLPLELRHEVFRYLLPDRPIGSSTAALHDGHDKYHNQSFVPLPGLGGPSLPRIRRRNPYVNLPSIHPQPYNAMVMAPRTGTSDSVFPMPALDLFLVNHQIYQEAKNFLFSSIPFTIDVRKDGAFMCGRRLLEPRRADGSSHFVVDEADEAKQRFLKNFDWSAVKHYAVDILVENWADGTQYPSNSAWDEEVELYDIRVIVSGVLAKSRNLCKLQIRLCLADFDWTHEQILANTKLILGPFERLRNVRQPQILGIFTGRPIHNTMLTVQRPPRTMGSLAPICSVPMLPAGAPVMMPGLPDFDAYVADWARWISSSSSSPVTSKPPIRAMFTEFKDFYSKLSSVVPDVTFRGGRHAFLHRARVAREQEDIESFRHLRNELIQYWYAYLDQEERKKNDMNARLSRMLDTDIYPSHEWEEPPKQSNPTRRCSTATTGSATSPILLDADTMAKEGIPMKGNLAHSDFEANLRTLQSRQSLFATQQVGCSMRIQQPIPDPHLQRQQMAQMAQVQAAARARALQQQKEAMHDRTRQAQLQLLAQQRQAQTAAAAWVGASGGEGDAQEDGKVANPDDGMGDDDSDNDPDPLLPVFKKLIITASRARRRRSREEWIRGLKKWM